MGLLGAVAADQNQHSGEQSGADEVERGIQAKTHASAARGDENREERQSEQRPAQNMHKRSSIAMRLPYAVGEDVLVEGGGKLHDARVLQLGNQQQRRSGQDVHVRHHNWLRWVDCWETVEHVRRITPGSRAEQTRRNAAILAREERERWEQLEEEEQEERKKRKEEQDVETAAASSLPYALGELILAEDGGELLDAMVRELGDGQQPGEDVYVAFNGCSWHRDKWMRLRDTRKITVETRREQASMELRARQQREEKEQARSEREASERKEMEEKECSNTASSSTVQPSSASSDRQHIVIDDEDDKDEREDDEEKERQEEEEQCERASSKGASSASAEQIVAEDEDDARGQPTLRYSNCSCRCPPSSSGTHSPVSLLCINLVCVQSRQPRNKKSNRRQWSSPSSTSAWCVWMGGER